MTQDKRGTGRRRGGDEGATAVEFAMVAGPLFFMILAIMELALVFVVSTTLENATSRASRLIRTGEFQTATAGKSEAELEAEFKTEICGGMSFLETRCADHLSVDVRTLTQFNDGGAPSPVQPDRTYNDEQLGVAVTGQGQRVLTRAFYRWPLLTPFLNEALEDTKDGAAVITATVVHQNEPF